MAYVPPPTALPPAETEADVSGPIEIKLTLGKNELGFRNGEWIAKPSTSEPKPPVPMVEASEVESLRKQLEELKSRVDIVEQERNLLLFKNKLLTELVRADAAFLPAPLLTTLRPKCSSLIIFVLQLAVAQLDLKRRDEEASTEKVRVEALKWKLTTERRSALRSAQ